MQMYSGTNLANAGDYTLASGAYKHYWAGTRDFFNGIWETDGFSLRLLAGQLQIVVQSAALVLQYRLE